MAPSAQSSSQCRQFRHLDAVFAALDWSDDARDAYTAACSIDGDQRWYFQLALPPADFETMLHQWADATMSQQIELKYVSLHYRACEDHRQWHSSFTADAFHTFVLQHGRPAPSASVPASGGGGSGAGVPDPVTQPSNHSDILLDAGLDANANLRENKLFQLNRVVVTVNADDLCVWRDTDIVLESSHPSTVMQWYARLQHEAALVHVHLCPLSKFRAGYALFSSAYTKTEILTMDDRLRRKLESHGTLAVDDPVIAMFVANYFGTVPQKLPSFRFLHDLLQMAFTAVENEVMAMPSFDGTGTLIDFATRLLRFQAHEHVTNGRTITDYELARRFLTCVNDSRVAVVDHLLTDLLRLDRRKQLPSCFSVTLMANTVTMDPVSSPPTYTAHRVNTRSGSRSVDDTAVSSITTPSTDASRRGNDRNPYRKKESPFYKPETGVICAACLRPGHSDANCIFFARHAFLTQFAAAHPDKTSTIVAKFTNSYGTSSRNHAARMLQRGDPRFRDNLTAEVAMTDDVTDMLDEDFLFAGHQG